MISVRSRRLLLNGSKLLAVLVLFSFITSCSKIFGPRVPKELPPVVEKPKEPEPPKKEEVEKPAVPNVNSIVLLLPFQLDRIRGEMPSNADVKRSEIPLDFCQGFKLALDNLAQKGNNFKLTVLDTKDNAAESRIIGKSSDIQSADLIVGPIFPKEIPAFAAAANLKSSLQVSPLAASLPSQFNVSNLVSLVASVNQHADGLANYLAKVLKKGDRIIIYDTQDEESHKFLIPLKESLSKDNVDFTEIADFSDIENQLNAAGKNFFITAAVSKYSVDPILARLVTLKNEGSFDIQLIGHPNWAKLSFDNSSLKILNAQITTSYYVDPNNSRVREFQRNYLEKYKIEPTEFAYKGFDSGYFFGTLLGKYGPDYVNSILKEKYKGLQTDYIFEKDETSGYVNVFIRILQFDGFQYRPIP